MGLALVARPVVAFFYEPEYASAAGALWLMGAALPMAILGIVLQYALMAVCVRGCSGAGLPVLVAAGAASYGLAYCVLAGIGAYAARRGGSVRGV